MGSLGMSVNPPDKGAQNEKPVIPSHDKKISMHYFGRSSDRQSYGITPESFTEVSTLPELLIPNKTATYAYVAYDEILELITKGSVLMVDQSVKPQIGHIVVIGYNGENLLRRFIKTFDPNKRKPLPALVTDNEAEPIIFIHPDYPDVHFKGVVRSIITFVL